MAVREKTNQGNNQIIFATFTILGWRKVFVSDYYFQLVYKWFDYMRDNYENKICGYVIMPNHIHVIIKLSDKSPVISKLIQNGKRFLAYGIVTGLETEGNLKLLNYFKMNANRKVGAKHKVFISRYDSKIVFSRKFFRQKLNYIHKNPCQDRWRLVEYPEDYPHSSASNYEFGKGYYDVYLVD